MRLEYIIRIHSLDLQANGENGIVEAREVAEAVGLLEPVSYGKYDICWLTVQSCRYALVPLVLDCAFACSYRGPVRCESLSKMCIPGFTRVPVRYAALVSDIRYCSWC